MAIYIKTKTVQETRSDDRPFKAIQAARLCCFCTDDRAKDNNRKPAHNDRLQVYLWHCSLTASDSVIQLDRCSVQRAGSWKRWSYWIWSILGRAFIVVLIDFPLYPREQRFYREPGQHKPSWLILFLVLCCCLPSAEAPGLPDSAFNAPAGQDYTWEPKGSEMGYFWAVLKTSAARSWKGLKKQAVLLCPFKGLKPLICQIQDTVTIDVLPILSNFVGHIKLSIYVLQS